MTTINTCTSSTRPGSPSTGDTLFETDTESLITYDGSAWKSYGADDGNYNLDGTNVTSVRPLCHFDAEFFNGVDTSGNPANDSSVGASNLWKSRVGSSYLFQETATKQPLYKSSGTNSKPYVLADGGDILLLSESYVLEDEFSMFGIAEADSNNFMCFFGGAGFSQGLFLPTNHNIWLGYGSVYMYLGQGGALNFSLPLPINGGETRAHLCTRDSSNRTKYWLDGDNTTTFPGSPTEAHSTNNTARFISTSLGVNDMQYAAQGNVYEFMLFNSDLSNADRNALGAYAVAKYGSGNLSFTNY